jgi:type IV pilus assembly protein PilA
MQTPAELPREHKATRRSAVGFSLIELLIVVAVILIIAAIAIPNFIRSKMRANEAAAVANLRNITTAEVAYTTTYGIGFTDNLPKLGGNLVIVDQNNAGLIDSVLSSGVKSGYRYSYSVLVTDTLGHVVGYAVTADPTTPGSTGDRHFYADQSAVVRHNDTGPAVQTDPPI